MQWLSGASKKNDQMGPAEFAKCGKKKTKGGGRGKSFNKPIRVREKPRKKSVKLWRMKSPGVMSKP